VERDNDTTTDNTPTSDEAAVEAELAEYARQQAKELGLERDQYVEKIYSNNQFKASHRKTTKLWVSGLSLAHDQLVARALNGLGYDVSVMDVPDNVALQYGKEFGNRAQCNPTYFTVGNLIKHLTELRDRDGLSTEEIVQGHAFLTAGACGPCRFGMYATEYRKALRDAGFEGFRVLLFQQQGGLAQATGEENGLKIDRAFAFAIVSAILAGDVLNLVGYRLRPYEVVPGSTKAALEECKQIVGQALETNSSVLMALWKCRGVLGKLQIDRSQPKPIVSVIGEFWAMTTEGDGNYDLYDFLEEQGAECDIQPVVNWLLYLLWEQRHDTNLRLSLKQHDGGRKGLDGKNTTLKMLGMYVGETAIRAVFQSFAYAVGLERWELPDMDHVAHLAARHYDNNLRGGEGHMEVGKLLHFVEDKVNHMTISVKPFGCMPSSGVSDGVQTKVLGDHPDAIFLPLETTGDGKVNAHSRVQMMLFKARLKARQEYEAALAERGIDEATFKAKYARSKYARNPFARPAHKAAGVAASLVYAV
jgi:predicted nucleotide-binding protein (sugar kinase/HSP70/actin superfamily)